jgi:hypothetical protein
MDRVLRYLPAGVGVAAIIASVTAADVWAVRSRRPTISSAGAELLTHTLGGPLVFGVVSGLVWHLVVDPVLVRLEGQR